jgi:hypothetical protein
MTGKWQNSSIKAVAMIVLWRFLNPFVVDKEGNDPPIFVMMMLAKNCFRLNDYCYIHIIIIHHH